MTTININTVIEKEVEARDSKNLIRTRRFATNFINNGEVVPDLMWKKAKRVGRMVGKTPKQVIKDAAIDDYAAFLLSKKGSRQGVAQQTQLNALRRLLPGIGVAELPPTGDGALRLHLGDVYMGGAKEVGSTKSIDAIIDGDDYISLKYVRESGGAQDNQIADAVNFIVNANDYVRKHRDGTHFTVIIDGEYGNSKIDYLRAHSDSSRVRVFTTETYEPISRKARA